MKHPNLILSAIATAILLAACGGGGDAPVEATPTPTPVAAAPSPEPTPSPSPTPTPAPTPTVCTADPIAATGYSLVFKGCSVANVAEYFDKTECVRDNVTGLIWQGQTPAGTGLRANDQHKTNYDSVTELQKYVTISGRPVVYEKPTQAEVDVVTNSIGFRNAVNSTNLCGSSAWRLPDENELLGLVKASESPMIDNAWFPNTAAAEYWAFKASRASSVFTKAVGFNSGRPVVAYDFDRIGAYAGTTFVVRLVR